MGKSKDESYSIDDELSLRMTALHEAVDIHARLASFNKVEPGAYDIVKSAENFYNFLSGGSFLTEDPLASQTELPDKDPGNDGPEDAGGNVIEVINI